MYWETYLDECTESGHLAFLEWLKMHKFMDMGYDRDSELMMDGYVPEETQKRWTDKHNAAKFMMMNRAPAGGLQPPPVPAKAANQHKRQRTPEEIEAAIKARFSKAKVTFEEPKQ